MQSIALNLVLAKSQTVDLIRRLVGYPIEAAKARPPSLHPLLNLAKLLRLQSGGQSLLHMPSLGMSLVGRECKPRARLNFILRHTQALAAQKTEPILSLNIAL